MGGRQGSKPFGYFEHPSEVLSQLPTSCQLFYVLTQGWEQWPPAMGKYGKHDSSPRDPKQGERGKIDKFNIIRSIFGFFAKMDLGASR